MATFEMPIEHAIVRTTVKLLAGLNGEPPTSTGTGFFYKVVHSESNIAKIMIITNKHVIAGAEVIQFVLSSATSVIELNDQHQPIDRTDQLITWPLAGNTYLHPDPEIDLCGIDITIPAGLVLQAGKKLRSMFIDCNWLPTQADRVNMRDIERVLVVGYPRGLWDEFNNMPIVRVGTTATHPLALYQGKSNFLVDVAAFAGSSGSPVFTYEAPMFRQPAGAYTPGTKVQFIGVVWGVIETTTEGELKIVDIPSGLTQVPIVNTSLNLAIVLHAEAIKALDKLIFPNA